MGDRQSMNDLMAWNADGTRLPYRMHSQYLRRMYLNNDLAEGRHRLDRRPIAMGDIRAPIFAVGTVRDHVAPWRSVYKINILTDADVTFLLTSGGHNAGIVSEPGHPRRHYQLMTRNANDRHVDPDEFEAATPRRDGAWWPEWFAWSESHLGEPVASPETGIPDEPALCDAPGTYVVHK